MEAARSSGGELLEENDHFNPASKGTSYAPIAFRQSASSLQSYRLFPTVQDGCFHFGQL